MSSAGRPIGSLVSRRARRLRDHLDEAGIKARKKQARDDTKFKLFRRHDGMVVLSGVLAPEQGEYWLSAYDYPRNCATGPLHTGQRRLLLDEKGHPLKLGRSMRTFTPAQRVSMSIRDGGCMFLNCDMPPSTTEAHHADQWGRDNGVTDIDVGLLLCASCHRRLHQEGWRVIADHGEFWLQPPAAIDPEQILIALPSKNPLKLELQQHQLQQSSATTLTGLGWAGLGWASSARREVQHEPDFAPRPIFTACRKKNDIPGGQDYIDLRRSSNDPWGLLWSQY